MHVFGMEVAGNQMGYNVETS